MKHDAFWKERSLDSLTPQQWELLCDRCARCCLHKIEDDETGRIVYTRIACCLLDTDTCRCSRYGRRLSLVQTCLRLRPQDVAHFYWLPRTCAYRLIAEGRELPWWHPLVSNDENSVHTAGVSVRGWVVTEEHVHPDGWYEHIIADM